MQCYFFFDIISAHDIVVETLIVVIVGNSPHDTSNMELYLRDSDNDSLFEQRQCATPEGDI